MNFTPVKLPSGKWNIRVYDFTDENGKKHTKSFTSSSKKEVISMAKAFRDQRNDNKKANKGVHDLTLQEAYERFISSHEKVLSPSTIRGYDNQAKKAFPQLMDRPIRYIDQHDIQLAINELAAKNSPKTVRNKYYLLKTVLEYSGKRIDDIQLPQKEDVEIRVPTREELQAILNAAPESLRIPIILGAHCGLRRGEVCALTPEDVTPDGIIINKSMVIDKNGKKIIKPPKTKAGYRTVPVKEETLNLLKTWDFNVSFNHLSNRFRKVCVDLGYDDIHFHCLRHYFVTELMDAGINPMTIKEYSGHETVQMIYNIYAHARRSKKTDDLVKAVF